MAVRFPQRQLVLAVASALLATSCSMLPPSLRNADEPIAVAPAPVMQAQPPAEPSQAEQPPAAKVFAGNGVFVNPRAPEPPPPPGPEEASLNFEGLDVREVAKVILGDYLKQSYTVHPGVAGTVTFRTVRPIARKDLLPTLEMLLRQNNAAVIQEDGVYKLSLIHI